MVSPRSLKICEYTEAMVPAVIEFNARLRAAGVRYVFPESHVPTRFPPDSGGCPYQQYFVAVDEDGAVRGGYTLKREESWIGDRCEAIADLQLPLSEGIVNRAYAIVGIQLLRDALRRQPLLYALGIGGHEESLAKLLAASAWNLVSVPFFFRVVHPVAFLRNMVYFRRSAMASRALDVLAGSGLGWLGIRALQLLRGARSGRPSHASVEVVEEFDDWASIFWEKNKNANGMAIVRNANTLRIIYPKGAGRFVILRVAKEGEIIGWAVLLDTCLSGHRQFGNMRLGSLVDCFAAPAHAADVVAKATQFLERQGVDLIVSNQLHAAWRAALKATGFMQGPSNYIFGTSPELTSRLQAAHVNLHDVHITRGDGDGPINL